MRLKKAEYLAVDWEHLKGNEQVQSGGRRVTTVRAPQAKGDVEKYINARQDHGSEGSTFNLKQHVGNVSVSLNQFFTGLKFFHKAGWIYRDLKPENLLQTQDKVMISDFGLVKQIGEKGTDVQKGDVERPGGSFA